MDLRASRAAYVERLERAAARVLRLLAARPEVHRLILIGSFAEGRRDLLTDLDVVVVMDSNQDWITRTAALHRELDVGVDLDLMVYTPAEFERMKERGFLKDALSRGKVIYAREAA